MWQKKVQYRRKRSIFTTNINMRRTEEGEAKYGMKRSNFFKKDNNNNLPLWIIHIYLIY